jgi:hypothetical protein
VAQDVAPVIDRAQRLRAIRQTPRIRRRHQLRIKRRLLLDDSEQRNKSRDNACTGRRQATNNRMYEFPRLA